MSRFVSLESAYFMKNLLSNFLGFIKAQHTEKYVGASIIVVCVICLCTMVSSNTCLSVAVDGKNIGYITSSATFDNALVDAKMTKEAATGLTFTDTYNTVALETTHTLFAKRMNTAELSLALAENVEWLTSGTVLNINQGETTFVLANEAEGQKVINALYAANTQTAPNMVVKSIGFQEDVRLEKTNVRASLIMPAEQVLAKISEGKQAVQHHEVVEGESLWTIATNNKLSVDELKALNPQLQTERLQIGQELTLTKQEPLVNVVLTKEVTSEEVIAHATQTEETSTLLRGETELKTAGQDGKKIVTYTVQEANGVTLASTVLNEVIVAEPVTAVVEQGTSNIMIASRGGSGPLSWPKVGRINSPYGSRSRGFHTGLDIDANVGDTVKASAGGKVVTAGWEGSYGNCVVLDHGNGLKTRYAHMSKLSCSTGDTVLRGEEIGKAGNTGNSTGPHVHFEVIVNGETRNPGDYLN